MECELFSFFASFFLFSKEKKKRNSLRNHLYTKDDKQINLQTPYLRNLTTCTRKHLNINVTNTGKGNNRRWQAQADSECNERIPPDGFDMTTLEVALRGRIPPPPSGGSPRTERSPLPCGHLPTPWGATLFKGGLFL